MKLNCTNSKASSLSLKMMRRNQQFLNIIQKHDMENSRTRSRNIAMLKYEMSQQKAASN